LEANLGQFPLSPEQWSQGVCLTEYVDGMKTYQADMIRRLDSVRLCPEEIAHLRQFTHPVKITALSEDWCVDCLMTLPIMAQIASALPQGELRIFSRSKWLCLKEYYNQREIMAIPAFSFLDEQFQELGVFVERPQMLYPKMDAWKAAHPEIEAVRKSATLSSEEKSAHLAEIRLQLQAEMENWYASGCQSAVVAEVAALLGI
jgi:hypothetical protein